MQRRLWRYTFCQSTHHGWESPHPSRYVQWNTEIAIGKSVWQKVCAPRPVLVCALKMSSLRWSNDNPFSDCWGRAFLHQAACGSNTTLYNDSKEDAGRPFLIPQPGRNEETVCFTVCDSCLFFFYKYIQVSGLTCSEQFIVKLGKKYAVNITTLLYNIFNNIGGTEDY